MWREYLCSRDVQEATRCLKDLEVPHFNHELMYEAVVMMIESMQEKTDEVMCCRLSEGVLSSPSSRCGLGSRGSTTRWWTSALMCPRLILFLKDGCCAAGRLAS